MREPANGRIVRLVAEADPGDYWFAEKWAESAIYPRFSWIDGNAMSFRAAGCAAESMRGEPWSAARDISSWTIEQLDLDDRAAPTEAASLPFAVGGMPFELAGCDDRARALDGLWSGWPLGRFWVPERVAVRTPTASWLIAQRRCRPGETLGARDFRSLDRWRTRWRRAAISGGKATEAVHAHPASFAIPRSARDRCDFVRKVDLARADISAGMLDKVVVARAAQVAAAEALDPEAQLDALARQNRAAVLFAWDRGQDGCWLGASPEVLARVNNGVLRTRAVAGTVRASGRQASEALLRSEKLAREHDLVVAGIVEALRPISRRVAAAPAPAPLLAGALLHLETAIDAELVAGMNLVGAGAALHPTPALAGAPCAAALAWLARHEGLDRALYGGPIGWMSPHGDGVLAVGIRAALIRGSQALAYAGAGIVAGSDPDDEWRETEDKLQVILQTLRHSSSRAPRQIEAGR